MQRGGGGVDKLLERGGSSDKSGEEVILIRLRLGDIMGLSLVSADSCYRLCPV